MLPVLPITLRATHGYVIHADVAQEAPGVWPQVVVYRGRIFVLPSYLNTQPGVPEYAEVRAGEAV